MTKNKSRSRKNSSTAQSPLLQFQQAGLDLQNKLAEANNNQLLHAFSNSLNSKTLYKLNKIQLEHYGCTSLYTIYQNAYQQYELSLKKNTETTASNATSKNRLRAKNNKTPATVDTHCFTNLLRLLGCR